MNFSIFQARAKKLQFAIICSAVAYNLVRFWEYEQNEHRSTNSFQDVLPLLRKNHAYFVYYYIGAQMITHSIVPFSIMLILNMVIAFVIRKYILYKNDIFGEKFDFFAGPSKTEAI